MAITLADQYYLKALEEYDYNLEETIENLNYALSYDGEHAGANYLMGKMYMEQFDKFELAEEYFVQAMSSDPENIRTCMSYTWLMVRTNRFDEAKKLITYTKGLKGVIVAELIRMEALILELKKDYAQARRFLSQAIEESYDSRYIAFLEEEIERVNKKVNLNKSVNYELT